MPSPVVDGGQALAKAGAPGVAPPMRVAVVSYLNAQPLVRGLRELPGTVLVLDIPSRLPHMLASGAADLAMLPIGALPGIPGARIACDYGIAADGEVASVALFSEVPLHEIEEVVLDHQSCTSVALLRILLRDHWQLRGLRFTVAQPGYIDTLRGPRAGLVIGDRALASRHRFRYHWDLAAAWKEWTGLPFVFAAWASTRVLPRDYMVRFAAANEAGLARIADVVAAHPSAPYDLTTYYTQNLRFRLDARMHQAIERFTGLLPGLAS